MVREEKFWLPLFSYQVIRLLMRDELSTSISPSPSTSAAKTDVAPLMLLGIVWCVKFWLPSFSCQAISSPKRDALSTSMSPSESTSAANTL